MAADLERHLQELVDTGKIPNAILYACDATGDFSYHSVFGSSSPVPGSPPLTEDVYLWAASSTKLYVSIAVMKLVEEGRLDLDGTVDALLPELASLKILTNKQAPWEYKEPENKITYRQLLTHTSGLTYFFHHPHMIAWKTQHPSAGGDVPSRFGYPLISEPGTSWEYSCGLDWAGLAVERTVGTTLCAHLQQILAPAGVAPDDLTFFPLDLPAPARVAAMAQRAGDGGFARGDQGIPPLPARGEAFCYGGHGGFVRGDAPIKVLRSLLAGGGGGLLGPAAAAEMLRAQLTPAQRGSINEGLMYTAPAFERTAARGVKRGTMDHSLCGNVDVEGQPWGRGKGTVMWGGAPNIKWFLDREKGLCGFFGAALLPSGDPTYVDVELEFEKAVYEMADKVAPVS
ncbi:putative beta-lactamase family protein [Diaporthe ampelina]|uniref:Putative beta-lactamase family protein n=1 Tax=Diaporthe ampelina TaxID=1214573 RepID=A0A0G2FZM9_9PEZI|nr:putative beta-lactamase family protein [Diaporthe ampelina]